MNYFTKTAILMSVFALSFINNKNERTLLNLQKAYQLEANAAYRHELYAKAAYEEGYKEVSHLFRAVAQSEAIHRDNHEEAIKNLGGTPENLTYEKVKLKSTKENLTCTIAEKQKIDSIYTEFIDIAETEKAAPAVYSFTYAREARVEHETFVQEALANLGKNRDEDYYVSDKTGETIDVSAAAPAPKPSLKDEDYIKVN